jgi:hypothetical protein
MLLLQALITLLRRSLGSVFRAIFGWATLALFGEVSDKDRKFLTAIVAAAAVWPVMLLGALLPRTAAFLLAFLPIPKSVPTGLVRGIWIALTILVPIAVGWTLRRRHPSDSSKKARLRDWLMGFPVTLGLAAAFTFACVAVPIRKLVAMASGRKEAHIPLVIPPEHYKHVAADIRAALDTGQLSVERATPPWTTRALSRTMRALGGSILGIYLPKDLEFLKGSGLELTVYPNGVRVHGPEHAAARAHALIAESATRTETLQTMTPKAQDIEKRIKALLAEKKRGAGVDARVRSLAVMLADTELPYEEWETLYRELLQLTIAVRGGGELLQRSAHRARKPAGRAHREGTGVRRITRQARDYTRRKLASSAGKQRTRSVHGLAEKVLSLLTGQRGR